jgi:alpha-1,4-digalacturonate transport system substrate-binding protein
MTKYGVNYPKPGDAIWTWDQFETEVNKLRAGVGTDVNFPGVFDPQAHRFFPMVYQHGTKIWSAPYTTSNLTGAAAVKALTRLVGFYETDLIDDAVFAGSTAAALFRTGAYGFHMSGNWNVSSYQDLTFNWTVVPMPKEAIVQRFLVVNPSLHLWIPTHRQKPKNSLLGWLKAKIMTSSLVGFLT